ncbi:MAG: tRNA preQ1(34) S-adenosylmethionine ribosyltransferase-isomerase QueA [Firmicutes bacterium]|nr:tRNA preQ1(34) S-adenosylmethionine ribosyltransferase-isomerase QueA [Bacillota bacterium]
MRTEEYDYELPERLIAQRPLATRSDSRLMVVDRQSRSWRHMSFAELPRLLSAGDLMIANDSRVLPARLYGTKAQTGAAVELLLLRPRAGGEWEVLARPSKRLRTGQVIVFGEGALSATVEEGGEDGTRFVRFSLLGAEFERTLNQLGEMPLPPYIKEKITDKERYQTVYSRATGSVAAPTAGLHFTDEVLEAVRAREVTVEFLTLHVGLGTFRPVQADRIEEHHMHAEWYTVPRKLLTDIASVRARGGRVLSVGTTTVRALESAVRGRGANPTGGEGAESHGSGTSGLSGLSGLSDGSYRRDLSGEDAVTGWTDIFLYPGVPLLATDALLTNFHLPRSTLLMLVSALADRDLILSAYEEAVREEYRFFSFGDAMLIL